MRAARPRYLTPAVGMVAAPVNWAAPVPVAPAVPVAPVVSRVVPVVGVPARPVVPVVRVPAGPAVGRGVLTPVPGPG